VVRFYKESNEPTKQLLYGVVVWLVDWLGGWLASWLIGWLVGWLVSYSVSQSVWFSQHWKFILHFSTLQHNLLQQMGTNIVDRHNASIFNPLCGGNKAMFNKYDPLHHKN